MTTKRAKKSTASETLRYGTGFLSGTDAAARQANRSAALLHTGEPGDPRVNPATLAIVILPIDSVSQHPRNNNRGDGEGIAESIIELGFFDPIAVQESTGYIITGNHTWEEYRRLGATEIPAIVHDVDDVAAVRMMITHNRLNRKGRDDDDATRELLSWLRDATSTDAVLAGTGWTTAEADALMDAAFPVAGDTTVDLFDVGDADLTAPTPKPKPCPNCGYDIAADRDRLDS